MNLNQLIFQPSKYPHYVTLLQARVAKLSTVLSPSQQLMLQAEEKEVRV